jgi:hypothetical protein
MNIFHASPAAKARDLRAPRDFLHQDRLRNRRANRLLQMHDAPRAPLTTPESHSPIHAQLRERSRIFASC